MLKMSSHSHSLTCLVVSKSSKCQRRCMRFYVTCLYLIIAESYQKMFLWMSFIFNRAFSLRTKGLLNPKARLAWRHQLMPLILATKSILSLKKIQIFFGVCVCVHYEELHWFLHIKKCLSFLSFQVKSNKYQVNSLLPKFYICCHCCIRFGSFKKVQSSNKPKKKKISGVAPAAVCKVVSMCRVASRQNFYISDPSSKDPGSDRWPRLSASCVHTRTDDTQTPAHRSMLKHKRAHVRTHTYIHACTPTHLSGDHWCPPCEYKTTTLAWWET